MPALSVNGADMDHQDVILSFAGTDRASSPGPETTVADTKQTANPFA
ncbi:integrase (plasmid) [Acetobacter orientalis]|uniref:Integrase n=1 Tax=Acetobacter orientalis TaxID=146474 RepID=A0A2Z5ZN07_9PROT|nr:integrase [Acetobacter orientalis]